MARCRYGSMPLGTRASPPSRTSSPSMAAIFFPSASRSSRRPRNARPQPRATPSPSTWNRRALPTPRRALACRSWCCASSSTASTTRYRPVRSTGSTSKGARARRQCFARSSMRGNGARSRTWARATASRVASSTVSRAPWRRRACSALAPRRCRRGVSSVAQRIGAWLAAWASAVVARPRLTTTVTLALTAVAAWYAAGNLGVNTDTANMISPTIPWRQHYNEYREAFPLRDRNLLIVVDAPTRERADEFAAQLLQELRKQPERYLSPLLAGEGAFFERNGLLYLP